VLGVRRKLFAVEIIIAMAATINIIPIICGSPISLPWVARCKITFSDS